MPNNNPNKPTSLHERWKNDELLDSEWLTELPDADLGGPGSGYGKPHKGRPGQRGGSLPRDAVASAVEKIPLISKKHIRAITDAMLSCHEYGSKTGYEQLVFISRAGEIVESHQGHDSGVSVANTPATAAAVAVVHNHPLPFSFSNADVQTFLQHNFEHLIVIAVNGDIFTLSKPKGYVYAWPFHEKWQGVYNVEIQKLRPDRDLDWIIDNYKEDVDFVRQVSHNANKAFAEANGLEYRRFQYGVDYGKK